jgi:hypothetical protein
MREKSHFSSEPHRRILMLELKKMPVLSAASTGRGRVPRIQARSQARSQARTQARSQGGGGAGGGGGGGGG